MAQFVIFGGSYCKRWDVDDSQTCSSFAQMNDVATQSISLLYIWVQPWPDWTSECKNVEDFRYYAGKYGAPDED